ncbi:GAF domain-containing protein [Acetobacter sp. LMG 1627]|uniref:GAF domain-containing protein n=2 Tax=Acetobacter conturbans TaxID=1737472 RepID=A0ABX0K2X3_9PROT|nr:GAF domain-containing protein [Acetobacter conturbans]
MALVGRGLELDVVIREILHLLSELLGLNRGRVVLPDEKGRFAIRYAYGLTPEEIARGVYELGEGVTGTVLRNRQLIVVQDIDDDPLFLGRAVSRAHLPQEKVAFIVMPIGGFRNEAGVIACHRLRHRNRELADDITILQIVSSLISQLLQLKAAVEEQNQALQQQNVLLVQALESATIRYGIVGHSPALLQAISALERVSDSPSPVLILGRSGTGKELFARALHLASSRREHPFIKINCAAIVQSTFDMEFFGYERGAFQGAREKHIGLLEQANTGTILFDNIDELSLNIQGKLIRSIEAASINRIGSRSRIPINIRVVATSTQDLQRLTEEKAFRYDLFYHLNIIPVRLPSLVHRKEDIPLLVEYFLNQFNQRHDRSISLSPDAVHYLTEQNWPGEIRQLSSFLERTVLLSTKCILKMRDIHLLLKGDSEAFLQIDQNRNERQEVRSNPSIRPYESVLSHSKEEILNALKINRGNKSRAAKMLGITYRQICYRIKKLSIS